MRDIESQLSLIVLARMDLREIWHSRKQLKRRPSNVQVIVNVAVP